MWPHSSSSEPVGRPWRTKLCRWILSIATMLPCNVVVRAIDDDTTVVEALDPDVMMGLSGDVALGAVATDARQRLTMMFRELTEEN